MPVEAAKFHLLNVAALFLFAGIACGQQAFDLQKEINNAIKAGGGEVVVPPGEHVLPKGVVIDAAKSLRIVGYDKEECVLKLPPAAFAHTSEAAAADATELKAGQMRGLQPGMTLHIEADGKMDAFTKKPKPYINAKIKAVEPDRIVLEEAIGFPIPAGTLLRDANAPNLIEIRGACERVQIHKLTLDGGRSPGESPFRGHAQLCGIMVSGRYSYEKGPSGPKPKGIEISDCIIRNCHGRGVAFYSVESPVVERCTIMDTSDEAVDLDHFTTGAVVRHNHVARSLVAFELNDASTCTVSFNEVRDCGTGVNLWRWCTQTGLNEGNVIQGNAFLNTTGNAVQIGKQTSQNRIIGNEIDGCGRNGISLFGEAQHLEGNTVANVKMKPVAVGEGTHVIR